MAAPSPSRTTEAVRATMGLESRSRLLLLILVLAVTRIILVSDTLFSAFYPHLSYDAIMLTSHLDLSEGAFKGLTGGHLDPPGQFNIVWHFNA